MTTARQNIIDAIAEYLETLYFDECPEEWADRPSMHEVEKQLAQGLDFLQEVEPIAHPDCVGNCRNFFDYSPERHPEPIKPTPSSRIKSAFTAIFRRNATI